MLSWLGTNAQFWTEKATGFTTANRGIYSMSIVDASVVWAIAFDNTIIPPDVTIKEFTLSTDGGLTWTPGTIDLGANTAAFGTSSITAVSSTTAWVSVYGDTANPGGIWKTIDGGLTWNKQTTATFNLDSYVNFVHFWDANNGIAHGDPESGEFEIYTTTDGGTTWTRVDGANIPDPDAGGEYGYENLYEVSGNNIWFGTDTGRIFKSTDKGLTWTVNSIPSPSSDFELDTLTFSDIDPNKGFLVTYYSQKLFSTMDGGATWSEVAKTGNLYNTDISFIPGTSILVSAASANPLGSSYSIDNGLNWITIDGIAHGKLAFLNDTFGFSGGLNTDATTGGVFKFTGIPLKTPNFDLKKQIVAYPNPTNGTLYLNSENSLIKEASVFDLVGRQVSSSKFSNLNNVYLDLKSLQTGTYLLKVTSDSGKTETIKIMKN